jgi:hypothetical protein
MRETSYFHMLNDIPTIPNEQDAAWAPLWLNSKESNLKNFSDLGDNLAG